MTKHIAEDGTEWEYIAFEDEITMTASVEDLGFYTELHLTKQDLLAMLKIIEEQEEK